MSAPTPPVDGWPSKKQPEKDEKIKEGSNAKTSEVASTSSNGAGKMIKATESEPSIGECEDELYAEAVREEQELVFHKFSKTNTPSNSNTSTEPSIKSISSDTQSIRIDPVEGSGHEGRIFVNLCDDTSPVLPEMTRPKSVIHITGIPASSAMFQPGENPSSSSVQTQNSVEDMLQLYVGLVNEDGQSSYANAVLQLLSSWKTLQLCVNSCKDDVPSTVSPSMHRSLDAVFREMGSVGDNFANGKVKVVQTKKFLSEFRTIAARSAGRAVFTAEKEHCALDFIRTVLQTLHSEVNKATRLKKESAQPAQSQPVESITSADEAWQQQVDTKDNSYLFLLVNSQLQSTVNCLTCGGVNSISWSTSWILNVPMPPPELAEKEEKKVLKLKDCIQHYLAEKVSCAQFARLQFTNQHLVFVYYLLKATKPARERSYKVQEVLTGQSASYQEADRHSSSR